jgi:hypothetical protein
MGEIVSMFIRKAPDLPEPAADEERSRVVLRGADVLRGENLHSFSLA